MYKTIILILVLGSIFLTGCAGNQVKETAERTTETAQESNTYSHQAFSIVLPAPFTENDGVIQPKKEKNFPPILIANSKEEVEIEMLTEFTKNRFEYFWTQTDVRGKFINDETVILNGKNGIKFTIQYPGRGYEDPDNGYINEYNYSILNGENLFQFWTSATDLENPETVSSQFDKIIGTISFK